MDAALSLVQVAEIAARYDIPAPAPDVLQFVARQRF